MTSLLTRSRQEFHHSLVNDQTLCVDAKGVASNADGGQRTSRAIAAHMAEALGAATVESKLSGQTAGDQFEIAVREFLYATVGQFPMLRPGRWDVHRVGGQRAVNHVAMFEPYRHLDELARAIQATPELASVLGNSYDISPDVLVTREPEPDAVINESDDLVDDQTGRRSIIREANQDVRILHAVVSCKWTLRSDRAQNARSEALNIIRNRKGRTPHIVVVTGEPTPSRLASLALGTGDLDMVYHFALPELIDAVDACGNDEAKAMLDMLVNGQRLRDIADLALDLTV
ncbi:MAG: NgoMIV family type II restriction endonuclease [Propioniciclava sp.]|uniref:NgoMIV family type II restriction endonuclease n=1 Tax=Propioniciclava sp. TaxID=2038686 RepID=UPI0039E28C50